MVSLEVCAPNTAEVGFRNMLSFICNYIIREVEAIYSNKSSRICSDRNTSEGILLNGLISLSFISSHSPHVQTFVSFFWGFAWEGALLSVASQLCAAWLGATAPGRALQGRQQPLLSAGWVALGCWSFGSSRSLQYGSTPTGIRT